ncbi:TolC family type I secretion outer membrane protein [Bradyrhizobium sp. i1.3.1]
MRNKIVRGAVRASGRTLVLFLAGAAMMVCEPSRAETLSEALVRAYQSSPQLNADRARQRGTDENVPQALAGYRPQVVASLSAGLQAVRNTLPDNTIQGATLRPWTIGVTVSQVLFNGFKTANSVRVAEYQVLSGREALRNTGQGVLLLDAVTAYMNVLANQALVEAQRTNVAVLREIQATTKKRLDAGDVTPTDTAQAEARLSRGLADLNAAEVTLAISKATYVQVIGGPPGQLTPATPVDRLSPVTMPASIETANHEHPAVLGAGYDVDVAQTTIKIAEGSLLPTVAVQANASRSKDSDSTLSTFATNQASILWPDQRANL